MKKSKILQLTDLHFEKNKKSDKFNLIFERKIADIIVLTGDIHNGVDALDFIKKLLKANYIVIYVLGNGEFYNFEIDLVIEEWKHISKNMKNFYFLESESIIVNDIEFFGSCLWTSVGTKQQTEDVSEEEKDKLSNIYKFKQTKNFNCDIMKNRHYEALSKLEILVKNSTAHKKVFLSHYLPSYRSIDPKYLGSKLTNVFASEINSFFFEEDTGINYWFHGHTHAKIKYKINKTNIICNPYGRKEDNNKNYDFNEGIIEL
jgi:predicted phosphodiesterase